VSNISGTPFGTGCVLRMTPQGLFVNDVRENIAFSEILYENFLKIQMASEILDPLSSDVIHEQPSIWFYFPSILPCIKSFNFRWSKNSDCNQKVSSTTLMTVCNKDLSEKTKLRSLLLGRWS
jgi:hypothetical protein